MVEEAMEENQNRQLERVIEALLFASDTPLSASKIAAISGAPSTKVVLETIAALSSFYHETGRSFAIVEVAGGYQIATLPEFSDFIAQLFKGRRKARLTRAALETLAIIAYKQPISRMQVEAIRGVSCEGVIATLLERELIAISGRGEGLGKPFLYSTTKKFLEYLGLKDHSDLPSLEEIEKHVSDEEMGEKLLVPPPADRMSAESDSTDT